MSCDSSYIGAAKLSFVVKLNVVEGKQRASTIDLVVTNFEDIWGFDFFWTYFIFLNFFKIYFHFCEILFGRLG